MKQKIDSTSHLCITCSAARLPFEALRSPPFELLRVWGSRTQALEEEWRAPTPFQQSVYSALLLIPRGKVTTYKLLSDFIGCKSAQAIGQALTRNPDAPRVPCHRVIKTDMTIGGYAFGVEKKRELLATEWVIFMSKGLKPFVDVNQIWDFS